MAETALKSLDLWKSKEEGITKVPSLPIIGNFSQISSICSKTRVDRIVVALDERRGKLPVDQLLFCRLKGIRVDEGPTFCEHLCGRLSVDNMYPSALIFSDGFKRSLMIRNLKRGIDIFCSLAGLFFLSPLSLAVGAAIKFESEGPVFYRQERIGEDGVPFDILKFRSMRVDAEKDGPVWAAAKDDRITKVGRVIRKLRWDEIPQMINVLRGEMSFVGPRPERPFFVQRLQKEIPFYFHRHSVKPGITGWAQICYPYAASKEEALQKLKYDLYYIKHMTPLLDIRILLKTIKVVLFGRGAR
jgi:sugar transferase (PEP-CTERM system associated)